MNRKYYAVVTLFALLMLSVTPVLAGKPTNNRAGAQKVAWNLSADVMPVPPYGSKDILGSDTASKLIVNEPNGAVEVIINGIMKGLNPSRIYTVYLSNGYTPYEYTGWSIAGDWTMRAEYGTGTYDHNYTFTQAADGTITGTGGYPAAGPTYTITETITGNINPMTGEITLHGEYDGSSYSYDIVAQVQADGTISGTWGNAAQGYDHPWYSMQGTATKTHTGNAGWPGLFTPTIQPFTFETDEFGEANWHLNIRDADFIREGELTMSVWINDGATILISDPFTVVND